MRTLLLTLAFSGMLADAASGQPLLHDQAKPRTIAAAMINNLDKGDFTGAERDFDETLKRQLSPEKLQAAWLSVTAAAGAYQKQLQVRVKYLTQEMMMVSVICNFGKKDMEVRVAMNPELKILGLWFLPTDAGLPNYADSGLFTEEAFTFASQETTLKGTLSLPKGDGPFKAVLLVHGSGPNDRDESIGANKPFRDIAAGLASRGIAVFRYDKRSGPPPGTVLADCTVKEEVLDDALSAAEALRSDRRINPAGIYLLGHSLGGQFAPKLAQLDGKLAGIVVAAGPVGSFGETLLRQYKYLAGLDGTVTDEERASLELMEKQAAVVDSPELDENTPAKDLPPGLFPKYVLSLRGAEPVKTAAGLQVPVLVLQGERDYQVTMDDFRAWKEGLSGKTNAVLKSYPGLNHLFMRGEGPGNPSEYGIPGNIAEEVITDIAAWLK